MKLSTKGRYGIKAMVDLAIHSQTEVVVLKNIAGRQHVSESYLEQLFGVLKKADLVKSIRGSQGGYYLANEPESITVGMILRALEGSLAPARCVEDNSNLCDMDNKCVSQMVWSRMRDSINEVVDTITLLDLINEHNNIGYKDDYSICI